MQETGDQNPYQNGRNDSKVLSVLAPSLLAVVALKQDAEGMMDKGTVTGEVQMRMYQYYIDVAE